MKAVNVVVLAVALASHSSAQPTTSSDGDIFDAINEAFDNMFNGADGIFDTQSSAPGSDPMAGMFNNIDNLLNNLIGGFQVPVNTAQQQQQQPVAANQGEQTPTDAMSSAESQAQQVQNGLMQAQQNVHTLAATGNANAQPPEQTHSVLCDMIGSLNQFIDSGLPLMGMNVFTNTVGDFDMDKHMGKWYQVYAAQFVLSSTESDMACIEAEYTKTGDHAFNIKDSWTAARDKSANGPGRTGNAEEQMPGRMRATYDGENNCISHGYYVLHTGPVVDGKYDWAIVSDPFAISARILARDPQRFVQNDAQSVLGYFANTFEGFMDTFVPISQDGCPNRQALVASTPSPAAPAPAPAVVPVSQGNSVMTAQQGAAPAETDDDNNALAIGLGVGLSLLFLALLALLGFCCYRRRQNTNAVKPLGAQKLAEPTSKDGFVKAADAGKQCNYCQGPACMYGGQVEHDIARKIEGDNLSAA